MIHCTVTCVELLSFYRSLVASAFGQRAVFGHWSWPWLQIDLNCADVVVRVARVAMSWFLLRS